MPKVVRVYGRELRLSGDEADDYYRHLPEGADATDAVLRAVRSIVREDAVCIDAGANLGLYALSLGLLATRGRVYAFEPSPQVFGRLAANVEANGAANVEVFQAALADHEGVVGFHEFPFFTAGSFTADPDDFVRTDAVGSVRIEVPCTTLDAFIKRRSLERLDVLKLDVEGAELAVLDGARQTLGRHRPTVVMEFNSFALSFHHGVVPRAALGHIRGIFPHVFVVDRVDGSLARLSTPGEEYQFLYQNGIHGPADNLLCSFVDLPVTRRFRFPVVDGAHPGLDAVSAAAELAAMRRTVSWRVTAPLRAARAVIDRAPPLPRFLARASGHRRGPAQKSP